MPSRAIVVLISRLPPHGGSGLKSFMQEGIPPSSSSPPARGEWIEIAKSSHTHQQGWSPPARGEWIEISTFGATSYAPRVSPRTGGVD